MKRLVKLRLNPINSAYLYSLSDELNLSIGSVVDIMIDNYKNFENSTDEPNRTIKRHLDDLRMRNNLYFG